MDSLKTGTIFWTPCPGAVELGSCLLVPGRHGPGPSSEYTFHKGVFNILRNTIFLGPTYLRFLHASITSAFLHKNLTRVTRPGIRTPACADIDLSGQASQFQVEKPYSDACLPRNVDTFNILSIKPEEKIRRGGARHQC